MSLNKNYDMTKINELAEALVTQLQLYAQHIEADIDYHWYLETASIRNESEERFGDPSYIHDNFPAEYYEDEDESPFVKELRQDLHETRKHIATVKQLTLAGMEEEEAEKYLKLFEAHYNSAPLRKDYESDQAFVNACRWHASAEASYVRSLLELGFKPKFVSSEDKNDRKYNYFKLERSS